jgi:DNA-binding transcriptional LysR family regulator
VADEIVVVVPSTHEWVGQQVEVQQLYKAPLILREKGSGTRRVVEAALKTAGIQMKHTRVVMELDSTEAIKSAVEAGLGVGFVSRRAIKKEEKLDTLREAHIAKLGILRTFAIIYPRGPEQLYTASGGFLATQGASSRGAKVDSNTGLAWDGLLSSWSFDSDRAITSR